MLNTINVGRGGCPRRTKKWGWVSKIKAIFPTNEATPQLLFLANQNWTTYSDDKAVIGTVLSSKQNKNESVAKRTDRGSN